MSGLKDEQLRVAFQAANRRAANALNDYANWLERDKLPKATLDFALGEENFGVFWRKRSWSISRRKKFSRSAWRN